MPIPKQMTKLRLNKAMAHDGYCSRRKADELIASGVVTVNGQLAKIGSVVDSESDTIRVDNEVLSAPKNMSYYAFYKPRGIITSLSDAQGESIKKFIPKDLPIYPVGRLDKDTEGLLILTNDGDFANQITHPSFNKGKIYHMEYGGKPSLIGKEGIIRRFTQGIMYNGKKYSVDSAKFIDNSKVEITIHEGKSRQLRIIAGKIGLEIISLKRIAIGKLKLSSLHLSPGKLVKISPKDVI